MSDGGEAGRVFQEAVGIMARLRAPEGCPWDREQTFDSVRRYTLEETYEVFDAIERRDWADLREELGDLLLQVLFYAQMAAEENRFTVADVVETLNAKLIRRHPHVFGDLAGANVGTERVLSNWEKFKQEERREKAAAKGADEIAADGLLSSVPRNLPATLEAQKIGSKAAKVGFDWPSVEGLFAKLEEEAGELRAEIASGDSARAESEVGDLLFTAVQLARHLHVDAEMALRGTNARFRERMAAMELSAASRDKELKDLNAGELEALWAHAKSATGAAAISSAGQGERAK
jgi:nucleoside triphosphate diphosphatase